MAMHEAAEQPRNERRRSFLKMAAFSVGLGWVGGSLLGRIFKGRSARASRRIGPKVTPHPQAVPREKQS